MEHLTGLELKSQNVQYLMTSDKSECAILNDFRWSDKIIPWADLLNLLEGEPIQVSVPKTHYAENPYGTKDTPIFATSKSRIRKYERGQIDDV